MGNTESAILSRVIDPTEPTFDSRVAQAISSLTFKPADRRRMEQLAEKACQGDLTPEEKEEINSYERVGHFLSLLKSKARLSLQQAAGK